MAYGFCVLPGIAVIYKDYGFGVLPGIAVISTIQRETVCSGVSP